MLQQPPHTNSRTLQRERLQRYTPLLERMDRVCANPRYRARHVLETKVFDKLLKTSPLVDQRRVKKLGGDAPPVRHKRGHYFGRARDDLYAHIKAVPDAMGSQHLLLAALCDAYALADQKVREIFASANPRRSNPNARAYYDGWRFGCALLLEALWPDSLVRQIKRRPRATEEPNPVHPA